MRHRRKRHIIFWILNLQKCYLIIIMSGFPEVQGGGSLILAWQIKNKHVLVVGGGEVSLLLIMP